MCSREPRGGTAEHFLPCPEETAETRRPEPLDQPEG